jgi:hypothetical protein
MSKLRMDTEEKMELLAYLETLLGFVKSLHASVGMVMAEVETMRESIFDDAEETAAYKHNIRAALMTTKPMAEEAVRSYDQLVEEIAASQRYTN